MRAQLFLFWNPNHMLPERSTGAGVTCRNGVCVKPVELKEQDDWENVVTSLARRNGCSLPKTNTNTVAVCADCGEIWAKTAVDGNYWEQRCQEPGADTTLGRMLAFMRRAAATAKQP